MLVKDQLNRAISLNKVPSRIVSLVPSQTELLVDLGLEDLIVGVTKFCVHPKDIRDKALVVGGTKRIHPNKIRSLRPDIIICNKEENTKAMVLELEAIAPVWVSDVSTIEESLDLIVRLGAVFKIEEKASEIVSEIKKEIASFSRFMEDKPMQEVGYLIWKDPYMAVGRATFINALLQLNKFENFLKNPESRYPEITLEELKETSLILLSSEPFPFKEKHLLDLEKKTGVKVILVDGEYFSWYGSRLKNAFSYFKTLH